MASQQNFIRFEIITLEELRFDLGSSLPNRKSLSLYSAGHLPSYKLTVSNLNFSNQEQGQCFL